MGGRVNFTVIRFGHGNLCSNHIKVCNIWSYLLTCVVNINIITDCCIQQECKLTFYSHGFGSLLIVLATVSLQLFNFFSLDQLQAFYSFPTRMI